MDNTSPIPNGASSIDGFIPSLTITPGAIALAILAILAVLLDTPSLAWYIKHRNLPASCLIFWIILENLFVFINALIWPTDNIPDWYRGRGLCDIEVKIDLSAPMVIICSMGCIMRNLARALNTKKPAINHTKSQQRRRNLIESVIIFGPALYMMGIHYVVQDNRFYVYAITGCNISMDASWPTTVLVYMWPCIVILWDAYYCILLIHRLRRYRKDFSAVLAASTSGLSKTRFMRLFALSFILLIVYLPVTAFVMYENINSPMVPYSWSRLHESGPLNIVEIPTAGGILFDRWIRVSLGFTVFLCFGLGKEATEMYRLWLLKLGFARIFPSLTKQSRPSSNENNSRTSFSSRVHLFFTTHFSKASLSQSTNSVTDASPTRPRDTLPRQMTFEEALRSSLSPSVQSTAPATRTRHRRISYPARPGRPLFRPFGKINLLSRGIFTRAAEPEFLMMQPLRTPTIHTGEAASSGDIALTGFPRYDIDRESGVVRQLSL